MGKRALTAAAIDKLKPPIKGQAEHFDAGFPGLACRISHGGAKSFVYFYRVHGKLRRMTLGRWPAMSLAEAREAWREVRKAVDRGEDPAATKPSNEFSAVADEWLQRDQGENSSRDEVERALNHDVKPKWAGRLISDITRRDCLALIHGIADRGAKTMSRRVHSYLHRLFRWAVMSGIIETNPMADLPKAGREVERDRVLTDTELGAVWRATEVAGWPFGPVVQMLILTAARRDDIGSLRWKQIKDAEITAVTKSKDPKPFRIPLSRAAETIISELPRVEGSEFVFTTTGKTAISGWSKAKRELDREACRVLNPNLIGQFEVLSSGSDDDAAARKLGFESADELIESIMPDWRLHDLRRTAATGMQRLGVSLQVVEAVLGHVSGSRGGIVGIYQRHEYADEKRRALEIWANAVEAITGNGQSNVVPLVISR